MAPKSKAKAKAGSSVGVAVKAQLPSPGTTHGKTRTEMADQRRRNLLKSMLDSGAVAPPPPAATRAAASATDPFDVDEEAAALLSLEDTPYEVIDGTDPRSDPENQPDEGADVDPGMPDGCCVT